MIWAIVFFWVLLFACAGCAVLAAVGLSLAVYKGDRLDVWSVYLIAFVFGASVCFYAIQSLSAP